MMSPRRRYGLRTAKPPPLSWAPARYSGVSDVLLRPTEMSPLLGVAICSSVATFVGSWGVQRSDVLF
eukprot:8763489-Pyramimonas_sp.AAC.1